MTLKPPFQWFGGKRRVAQVIWDRLGDVPTYIEPFFGGGAVLLGRPHEPRFEVINDIDGFVVNFWRAVKSDWESVAKWSDWPVNTIDLHARHHWLVKRRSIITRQLMADPDYFDAKVAGWWVWGLSQWFGGGWCPPKLTDTIRHPNTHWNRGVTKLPPYDHFKTFESLCNRLRYVKVYCGDWSTVIKSFINGPMTSILFDPPYDGTRARVYSKDDMGVAQKVIQWCLDNAHQRNVRIALCGYGGMFEPPDGWETYEWKTDGGMSNLSGKSNFNSKRERIWFSPHCLKP